MTRRYRSRTHAADEALIFALACGATVEVAAHRAGMSERTAYRRLEDEPFRKRIKACNAEQLARSSGMLTAITSEAVKTLHDLLAPGNADVVRVRSACAIIEQGMKLRQSTVLEERMSVIEERLQNNDQQRMLE